MVNQQGAENGDVALCSVCSTRIVYSPSVKHVDREQFDWPRCRRSSRLVGKYLHDGFRLIPSPSSCLGRWHLGAWLGAAGGMIFAATTGFILERINSNYTSIFVICGCAYLVAYSLSTCSQFSLIIGNFVALRPGLQK
jgi:hypothetical protein